MLYISLREGEHMKIGDDITISCTRAGARDTLSLGIDAPRSMKILRSRFVEQELEELANAGDTEAQDSLLKIQHEKEAAQQRRENREKIRKAKSERRKATAAS